LIDNPKKKVKSFYRTIRKWADMRQSDGKVFGFDPRSARWGYFPRYALKDGLVLERDYCEEN
jgi:hypothetical protein